MSKTGEVSNLFTYFNANSIQLYFDRLSCVHIAELAVDAHRDWIVRLSIPSADPTDPTRSYGRGYGYASSASGSTPPEVLVSVSRTGLVGLHSWASHDKLLPYGFSLERDSTLSGHPRNRRKIGETSSCLHPSVQLNNHLICVSSDCRYLFVGGQFDNSVKAYALPRLRLLGSTASAPHHIDIVTCLALDEGGALLMTGSRDTTCVVWEVTSGGGLKSLQVCPFSIEVSKLGIRQFILLQVLYGHDKPVSCVGLSASLDMAVSGSLDGTVNVHTIKEGQYIRTLEASTAGSGRIGGIIVTQLWLSERGDVVFATEEKDGTFSIAAHAINGQLVGSARNSSAFTSLTSGGDG